MSRRNARMLQNFGMLLIVVVMLTDKFLFTLKDEFILVCAVVSAIALAESMK